MNEEEKIKEFFLSFERVSRLIDERSDLLDRKINDLRDQIYLKEGIIPAPNLVPAPAADPEKLLEELGPISELINDHTINDILINGTDAVYIERQGKLEKTHIKFANEQDVLSIAEKIAAAVGRFLDPERPYVDARLPDGSRVNIIAPPLAIDGTSISIRKFSDNKYSLDNLVQMNCLSQDMADFLKIASTSRINIVIVGGTGTGKTTLLNAIAQYITPDERIVTIEDAAELRLPLPHKVRLESKPYIHGKSKHGEVSIRDLVMNALRMRPDRIIVGETRGGEAFDMIQAMNTGHEGSMTTIHANNARDALLRMENMINMAVPNLPSMSVKQRIASAINLLVIANRMNDGSRRIVNISEITGMEGDQVILQSIFEFKEKGISEQGKILGDFVRSGIMPRFSFRTFRYGFKEQMSKIFQSRF